MAELYIASNIILLANSDAESKLAEKYLAERQIKCVVVQDDGSSEYRLPTLLVYGAAYIGFDAIKLAVDIDENLR